MILFASTLLIPQANAAEVVTRKAWEMKTITEVDLIRMVDNFIVYFDTSSSANNPLEGTEIPKIKISKEFLQFRNAWLPDLGYNAGLYIYTPFEPVFPMATYDRALFSAAIDKLPERGKGAAMMQAGLSRLREVVAGLSGRTAVMIFTDGRFSIVEGPNRPLQIAKEIARDHDVCFYVISSATGTTQRNLERAVASINPCSRVISMQTFMNQPYYLSGALFKLKFSSYAKIRPASQVVGFAMNNIYFDFNSAEIRPDFKDDLEKLARFMQDNPNANAVVSGYACNIGSDDANMMVSRARAKTVSSHLINYLNVPADRLIPHWYGSYNPAADNGTAEGRSLNRRVEIAVTGLE
jgi:OOP family OmpA-OmpF porin